MGIVYIVIGETGENDDYCEWLVEAYLSEAAAQARIRELAELMQAVGATPPNVNLEGAAFSAEQVRQDIATQQMQHHERGDPNFKMVFESGTRYRYQAVDVKG